MLKRLWIDLKREADGSSLNARLLKKDLDKLQNSSKTQTQEIPKSNGLVSGAMYKGYTSAQYKKIQE